MSSAEAHAPFAAGALQALEQALACHRTPSLVRAALARPLPDMHLLLRIAADEQGIRDQCAHATGETPARIAEAAVFFVQQLQFAPDADSYRVLGVHAEADDARIKTHHRWLVRWLHPDRNPDPWEAAYADRVNRAWQDLRTPERRRHYDAAMAGEGGAYGDGEESGGDDGAAGVVAAYRPVMPRRSRAEFHESFVSPRTAQNLPLAVMALLGAIAGAVLMLMWNARDVSHSSTPTVGGASAPTEQPAPPQLTTLEAPPLETAVTDPASVGNLDLRHAPEAQEQVAAEAAPTEAAPAIAVAMPVERAAVAITHRETGADRPAVPVAPPRVAVMPVPARVAAEAAPTATRDDDVDAETEPVLVPEFEARAVLDAFSAAYARGDLPALMALFTADARNNRGGRADIRADYRALFAESDSRALDLQPIGTLLRDDGGITVLARYASRVQHTGRRRATQVAGDIRFELRPDAAAPNHLKIQRILHDED